MAENNWTDYIITSDKISKDAITTANINGSYSTSGNSGYAQKTFTTTGSNTSGTVTNMPNIQGTAYSAAQTNPEVIKQLLAMMDPDGLKEIEKHVAELVLEKIDTVCPNCERKVEIPEHDYICRQCRGL